MPIVSIIVVLGNATTSPVQAYTRDAPLTLVTYHDKSEMLFTKLDTEPPLTIYT